MLFSLFCIIKQYIMKIRILFFLVLTFSGYGLSAQLNLDTSDIALHLAQRYQNVLNTIDDAVVEGKIRAYVSEDLNESYDSVLNIQHYSYKISSGNVDSKVGYIHDAVVLDNVKSNRRNFHKALVVYQQVHIKEGVQLNFKALGMGTYPVY